MPPKQAQTGLMSRLGSKIAQAHEAHKNDDTTFAGGASLPEGIDDGVAVLTEIKFGIYGKGDNQGQDFVYLAGTVIAPEVGPNGKRIEGLRTSKTEPLCDTPNSSRKTFDDHWAWFLNELRKLGLDTSTISAENVEAACQALVSSQVQFGFRTWKGEPTKDYPNPRVQETWEGALAGDSVAASDGVVDNTPEASAAASKSTPAPKASPKPSAKPTKAPEPAPEPEPEDLDTVLAGANSGDEEAQRQLSQMAIDAGVEQDSIDNAADWDAVAVMIREAQAGSTSTEATGEEGTDFAALAALADDNGDQEAADKLNEAAGEAGLDPNEFPTWAALAEALAGGAAAEEPKEEFVPEKGNTFLYRPNDPKTKKPVKKPIEVEVTAVFGPAKTVNLKNLDDGKTVYKSVPWDALEAHS